MYPFKTSSIGYNECFVAVAVHLAIITVMLASDTAINKTSVGRSC